MIACVCPVQELVAIDNVTCSGQPMTTVTALMGGNPGDPVQLVVKVRSLDPLDHPLRATGTRHCQQLTWVGDLCRAKMARIKQSC